MKMKLIYELKYNKKSVFVSTTHYNGGHESDDIIKDLDLFPEIIFDEIVILAKVKDKSAKFVEHHFIDKLKPLRNDQSLSPWVLYLMEWYVSPEREYDNGDIMPISIHKL